MQRGKNYLASEKRKYCVYYRIHRTVYRRYNGT